MSDTKKTQHLNFEGELVSVAENKTIHVIVKTTKMHPKYRKQYVVSRKFAVHDEHSRAKLGNLVTFVECRPISKTKKWTLVNIIK